MDFAKFDKEIDLDGLRQDISNASKRKDDFDKVPVGTYEVKITKMELRENSKGSPMLTVWFKILDGEYKGQLIFMNQTITKGFQIHICNEFLRSLDSGKDVVFEGYAQYDQLVYEIFDWLNEEKVEYALEYGKRGNYDTFKIVEVFEGNPL